MTLKLAVVGGGVSGLAAAHRALELGRAAGRPVAVSLFEARARLGGAVGTERRDGYLVEMGADMFVTDKPWALSLCERLGLGGRLVGANAAYRRSLVLRAGKPLPVPEGFMLMAPARLGRVLASPILSLRGKLRILCEPFVPARHDDDDESLGAFARRRLGKEALERLVEPLVAGIYTGDPEHLSLRATLPRFLAMEREHGSLWRGQRRALGRGRAEEGASGARYGLFVSFPDGMAELLDALETRLRAGGVALELGTSVLGLERTAAGFALTRRRPARPRPGRAAWTEPPPSDGETVRELFDAVVVALPAPRGAALLAAASPALAAALGSIEHASSAIVVSGYRRADVRHPLDAFGLVVPAAEGRQIFSVSFASRKFPGRAPEGHVLLRSFVGGLRHGELLRRSDEALCALVRRELAALLGVGGRPDFELVARHERAMPQYDVGHLGRVAAIERLLAAEPALAVATNALHGVGVPDCVHAGERAAEHVWARATAPS
ncbi:MAG: protoporphyrinogen oxidase [Polyangiaceae bacterium]|nr:protoporphyrinogen oxidase [Polyangiaceae bacterium]